MEQLQLGREGLLLQGHVHELLKQYGMLPAGSRVPIKLWKKPLKPWEKLERDVQKPSVMNGIITFLRN